VPQSSGLKFTAGSVIRTGCKEGDPSDPRDGIMKLRLTLAVRSMDKKRPFSVTMETAYSSEVSESMYMAT
jgi:hypothetical protein